MDHFARPEDELAVAFRERTLHRNFQGYTTRAGASLYGFGMSSISQTDGSFRQNHKELPDYEAAINEGRLPIERGYLLSEDDRRRRTIITDIMCARGLDFARLTAKLGHDFVTHYATELATLDDLLADGLIERHADQVTITPLGYLFLRIIAMRFDAHLEKKRTGFSKVV
jgi:oxygen-independent coproporphyrinogen III oxidase